MNNHIKVCPYCQGDGIVPKSWQDIKVDDMVYYEGLYIHSETVEVKVYRKKVIDDLEYYTVIDSNGWYFTMFKNNFKGFV